MSNWGNKRHCTGKWGCAKSYRTGTVLISSHLSPLKKPLFLKNSAKTLETGFLIEGEGSSKEERRGPQKKGNMSANCSSAS